MRNGHSEPPRPYGSPEISPTPAPAQWSEDRFGGTTAAEAMETGRWVARRAATATATATAKSRSLKASSPLLTWRRLSPRF